MILLAQRNMHGLIYSLFQTGGELFALLVNDEDSGELLTRYNGTETIIRARFERMTKEGNAK